MATPNLAWSCSALFVLNPFASGLCVIMLTFLGGVVALATGAHYAVDVAVYDASSGGVVAAVAAARHGAKTLLICASWPACHPEGGLRVGGMSSGGLGETDIGSCSDAIGGIAQEFYRRNREHYGNVSGVMGSSDCRLPAIGCNETFNLEPHVALEIFETMLREAGVTVIYAEQVETVSKAGTLVTSITLTNGTTVSAKVFIEASYEADLLARAGVSYIVGRESNTTYNESLNGNTGGLKGNQFTKAVDPFYANGSVLPHVDLPPYGVPGEGDKRVQAYNFRLCISSGDNAVAFVKPDGYNPDDWELLRRLHAADTTNLGCGPIPRVGNKCDMNNGGGLSTDFIGASWRYPDANYSERKEIWEAHKRYTQGYLWTVANDPVLVGTLEAGTGLCADEFNRTDHFPPALYVRAARRLVGSKVFTQNTPKEQSLTGGIGNLSIGVGCYNFDSHNAQRIACLNKAACFGRAPSNVGDDVPYAWDEGDVQVGPGRYQIPFWVTQPAANETTNLLVIASPSASHIGMSTLRMEPQFMIIGHSVGVAAAMAAAASGPANVNTINLDDFHAKLIQDNQTLSADRPVPPLPMSVCELGRCIEVDVAGAKAAARSFNDTTCGNSSAATASCSELGSQEWLANTKFWTSNTSVGSLIFAMGDTILKKSTVFSGELPASMQMAVSKGSSCRLLNTSDFDSYVLCSRV